MKCSFIKSCIFPPLVNHVRFCKESRCRPSKWQSGLECVIRKHPYILYLLPKPIVWAREHLRLLKSNMANYRKMPNDRLVDPYKNCTSRKFYWSWNLSVWTLTRLRCYTVKRNMDERLKITSPYLSMNGWGILKTTSLLLQRYHFVWVIFNFLSCV